MSKTLYIESLHIGGWGVGLRTITAATSVTFLMTNAQPSISDSPVKELNNAYGLILKCET